ncbi:hypothetical protein CMI37_20735 [Candidatus Pacearchaeota archaeon]|nr:hypothetical protein [Candidatus Pacearchaeota archaeon]|tara:strand:+ start:1232 stop:1999 length:768 start_codon:yes stop_codon:yes gene_type:complete
MNYKPSPKPAVSVHTNTLIQEIQNYSGQIRDALPKHLNATRITRIIMTEVRKNPKLAECSRASFFGAILQASSLGLEIGSGLGHAYLVPFKNEVQLITGYQGMIDLAERSGKVTIDAHVVYEKDEFNYELGLNPILTHKPYTGTEDRGMIIASYAVARYVDGRTKFRVLNRQDIDKAREAGNKNSPSWKNSYDEMARKTPIRRLFKMLPKSPDMATVQELEDKIEIGESQELDYLAPKEIQDEITVQATEEDHNE